MGNLYLLLILLVTATLTIINASNTDFCLTYKTICNNQGQCLLDNTTNNTYCQCYKEYAGFQCDYTRKKQAIIEELSIEKMKHIMVNINFSLGFKIKRAKLATLINGKNGFIAIYDNSIHYSVTIELPYDTEKVKRNKKLPCFTFIVYRSGLCTMSGPDRNSMEAPFNLFKSTMEELTPEIRDDTIDLFANLK